MSSVRYQKIIVFYHSETSGSTRSILTLRNNKYFIFIKTPSETIKFLKIILKNIRNIAQNKLYIINGLGALKFPSLLILTIFLKIFTKRIFIYWHESGWIWRGLIPEKQVIGSIVLHKILRYVVKNSINMAISKITSEWLKNKFQLKTDVELLYNTINYRKVIELSKAKPSLYLDNNLKTVVALATLSERKGFHLFVEAADKSPSNYRFVWIGKSRDLNNEEAIRVEKVNRKNNFEKIIILEYNPNPYPIIKNTDIFFIPSLDEPFGLAYLEAFVLGKFVIAPKIAGFSEVIEDNSNKAYIYKNIEEVYDLFNSDEINHYIDNFKEERCSLAKEFDNLRFHKTLIRIIQQFSLKKGF